MSNYYLFLFGLSPLPQYLIKQENNKNQTLSESIHKKQIHENTKITTFEKHP